MNILGVNMNKKLITAAVMAASMSVLSAHAAENGYLSLGAGASFPNESEVDDGVSSSDIEMDAGYLFTLAMGTRIEQGFRFEAEYSYRAAEVTETGVDGDVSVHAAMLNGFLDIETSSSMQPYIGAGLGAANMNWDGDSDDNETVSAYQLMAGINIDMNPETTLRLGYRYFNPREADIGSLQIDNAFHDFEIGLRWNF